MTYHSGRSQVVLVASKYVTIVESVVGNSSDLPLATRLASELSHHLLKEVVILNENGQPFSAEAAPQVRDVISINGMAALKVHVLSLLPCKYTDDELRWCGLKIVDWPGGKALGLV